MPRVRRSGPRRSGRAMPAMAPPAMPAPEALSTEAGRVPEQCDCAWANAMTCAGAGDGSACWRQCCQNRRQEAVPEGAAAATTSLCMVMMRWGSWPAWIALTMRTLELNPSVTFFIVGDKAPTVLRWPSNCKFVKLSMDDVMSRAHKVLGASPGPMKIAGTASKISDFKPMLGALFPELLTGCSFWGYMQEDQFIGSMRAYLDEATLAAHDTISPLIGGPCTTRAPILSSTATRRQWTGCTCARRRGANWPRRPSTSPSTSGGTRS